MSEAPHESTGCCDHCHDGAARSIEDHGHAGASCCEAGVPVFDGLDPRYKRVLWAVIAINASMFLTETIAGQLAGSQALKADALDFLADTVTYGLSLSVVGATLRTRSMAALLKGLSLSVMAAG